MSTCNILGYFFRIVQPYRNRSKSSFGRQMSGQFISSDHLSYCHDFILSLLQLEALD